jgi:penicillin-binding protein 2
MGVERRFDGMLRGEAGGRLVRVDVSGFRHEDLAQRDPKSGSDLRLALDLRVQRLAEKALGGTPGALVVLDPRNGDVLAMVGEPGFDPNVFVPAISPAEWARIDGDERKPLVNRAMAEHYAPGSIFKPVVALAALENGLAHPGTTFHCPGYFDLGRARFNCWTRGQHGDLNMQEAIKHSCNVYFYRLGLQCGQEYIYHMASAMGLGRQTGISLPNEVPGRVPNAAWMRETRGHGWRAGDTCNFSIGQGDVAVTPLQMAVMCATLANGGHVYQPRLVLGVREPGAERFRPIPPHVANEMNWSATSLQVVRGGMRDVIMSERGTGKLARVPGVEMAGKTGTAEYGKKEEGKKRGWMIAFAPFDAPRYAVALVVDDAISGGVTAAPRIKQLMSGLLGGVDPAEGQG